MILEETYTLSNGVEIPKLGLGTWFINDKDVVQAVKEAEKIFYPDRKLSTEGAPSGFDPSVGDITYYAPWGDIAIFYKDFGHAGGLISLGRIDHNGIEQLRTVGGEKVTFELMTE